MSGLGGGVNGGAILERCSTYDNRACAGSGGGVAGPFTMRRCVVADNFATTGGGVFVYGGSAVIEDSIIVNNEAFDSGFGGGVMVDFATGRLAMSGTLVAGNFVNAAGPPNGAVNGAGLQLDGPAAIDRCTIVGDFFTLASSDPGAITGGVVGGMITNSIVANNEFGQLGFGSNASYCLVQGGASGTGNINGLPSFVDPLGGDYHLVAGALGINAGDPNLVDPDGSRLDLGAFEFQTLYSESNSASAKWADPSWSEISMGVGGRDVLKLVQPNAAALDPFVVAGSLSGTSPGIPFQGTLVPLNFDAYTQFTLGHPNGQLLSGFHGQLDAQGRASMSISVPAGSPGGFIGMTANHAGVVLGGIPVVTGPTPTAFVE